MSEADAKLSEGIREMILHCVKNDRDVQEAILELIRREEEQRKRHN